MNLVDFSKTDEVGLSIFGNLMQQGMAAHQENHPLFGNLISRIEDIFFFLISAAKEHLDEEKINQILESPGHYGQTVFSMSSDSSEKISGWILDRNIDVAFVDGRWWTPMFWFESNFEKMLKKEINPFFVSYNRKSMFDYQRRIFESIDQKFLEPFLTGEISEERTEVYHSFQDSECSEICENLCKDKMLKFKLYTGKRNFKNGKKGGQGSVSFGPAAFKLLELGKIENVKELPTAISNAEKTRAEFETAKKLKHPNIVRVIHSFRYQETEKLGNLQSLDNWTVIVMEKHDKNIGELTSEERNYLPHLLNDVLGFVLKYI